MGSVALTLSSYYGRGDRQPKEVIGLWSAEILHRAAYRELDEMARPV